MTKPLLFVGAASLGLCFAAPMAMAQDWLADPIYGYVYLSTGFEPDPHQVELTAGGPIDVSGTIGAPCTGFIASAPDFDLYFETGSSLPLAISVNSDADTTLVIHGADGRWYCDDDSGGGRNPSIVFQYPEDGLYDIWVGTYNGDAAPATLAISEVSTY